jgi:cephalosporin hydroxylase
MIQGNFNYRDIPIQQHEDIQSAFYNLIASAKPSQILEIGTASGGLTLMIKDILNDLSMNTTLRTYDVEKKHYLNEGNDIEVIIKNVFNDQYDALIDNDVKDYINREGRTIVLCDGGNKINEFNILSEYLKDGDIIMAHDYCCNTDEFFKDYKDKIWNWLEIQDSDISESVAKYNLKPYMKEQFKNVVWVCKIK